MLLCYYPGTQYCLVVPHYIQGSGVEIALYTSSDYDQGNYQPINDQVITASTGQGWNEDKIPFTANSNWDPVCIFSMELSF